MHIILYTALYVAVNSQMNQNSQFKDRLETEIRTEMRATSLIREELKPTTHYDNIRKTIEDELRRP